MHDNTRILVRKLRPILASIAESVRARFDSPDDQARESFLVWQTHHLFPPHNPLYEFCLQTAFMQFVHAYLVRICEEYALVPAYPASKPENIEWLASSMKVMRQVLKHLDNSTLASFVHSFDWFAPDEQCILQLYRLLRQYHFKTLDADMLGKVYNEGFIEQRNRSEKGQFYTPLHVVNYMLNTLEIPALPDNDIILTDGYRKYREYLFSSVADLSCGSGSFLVAAAARKRAILQQLVAAKEFRSDTALRILTDTLVGFDLNPFACYLSTINLLIQCLPFLDREREDTDKADGGCKLEPLQFSVYCIDALDVQAMEQTGLARHSFDYLVGNPPYVSANESFSNLLFRNKIRNAGHYRLLSQKWDLFVPFFERNLQLLQPESGRLGLIVSSGIETEGYAEYLRQALSTRFSLLQIDFFPGLRLFQDAAVENTIVLVENKPPEEQHEVIRRRHFQPDCQHFETLPTITQMTSNGHLFRWRYNPLLDKSFSEGTVPLCSLVYIGTGLEAQSDEDSDPEVDGIRQKRFTLNDVFLPPSETTRPTNYVDDGVLGDDVDRYYLRRTRFVAYEKYRPQMRGPRHIALFHTPEKLLLGETSGGYYDRSGLFANHSVQVVVPWKALEQAGAIGEKGIQTVWRKSQQLAGKIANFISLSELFDLRYLLGIINSRFMRQYIASNLHEGTRQGRIYPDIWKRLPIKIVSAEKQQSIARLVDTIQRAYQQLETLPTPRSIATDPTLHYRDIQGYLAQGILQFTGDVQSHIAEKPFIRDGRLIVSRQPFAYIESSSSELLRYLEIYLTKLHPEFRGWTWADARKQIQAPTPLSSIQKFIAGVDNIAIEDQRIHTLINSISAEIEELVEKVYAEPADAELLKSVAMQLSGPQNGELF